MKADGRIEDGGSPTLGALDTRHENGDKLVGFVHQFLQLSLRYRF